MSQASDPLCCGRIQLPISDFYPNFERLADESFGPHVNSENQGALILCPYFWEHERSRPDSGDKGKVPNTAEFDLVICILWSHLGALPAQTLRLPDGSRPRSGTEYEVAWAVDHAKKNRGIPSLQVYRNCSRPTPPSEPGEDWEVFGRQWDSLNEFRARTILRVSGRQRAASLSANRSDIPAGSIAPRLVRMGIGS
jgi:hypothetical protein